MKYTIIQTETFTHKIKTEIVVDDKPPKKEKPDSPNGKAEQFSNHLYCNAEVTNCQAFPTAPTSGVSSMCFLEKENNNEH